MKVASWISVVLGSLLVGVVLSPQRAAAQDFTVTAPTMTAYVINGQNNPPLPLTRGRTYTFAINTPGHPFYIKTAQVTGTGSQYLSGVTNNGATTGTLTFAVPSNTSTPLYYQCSVHSVMTGAISMIDPPPVPASSPWTNALLAALLLVTGVLATRLRRRTPASSSH